MTNEQVLSLETYYKEKYGTPADDKECLYILTSAYRDLFNEIPTNEIRTGIAEYFRLLTNRQLPAYLWILEALHVTSKKEKSKRNFPYLVGMLRTWMRNGFGHIPNQEEEELAEYFQEITGYEISVDARKILQNLMGNYGVFKITRFMNELKDSTDKSVLMMVQLQTMLDEKFSASDENSITA